MFDYIINKFLPFGLARTFSLAGIPLLQFIIVNYCSTVEAGKFYLLTSLAFILSQIADLGLSRAFPVLFGADDENVHSRLAEIMKMRWFLGLFFGSLFLVFNSFGSISWNRQSLGLLTFFFCFGRVILLGNQGYRHARQQFSKLLVGAWANVSVMAVYFFVVSRLGTFNANTAIAGLALGIWAELVLLNSHLAHPFSQSQGEWKEAFLYIFPFASVGMTTAVYNRIEAVVAGFFLSPALIGVFGTLDQAFKLAIWPSYLSAQTVFPDVNLAIENKDKLQLENALKKHFMASSGACIIMMNAGIVFWYFYLYSKSDVTIAALILWLAVWMAIPSALMDTLFFSFRMQSKYAFIKLLLSVARIICAVSLVWRFGFIGLCATHSIITALAVLVLWKYLKPHLLMQTKS